MRIALLLSLLPLVDCHGYGGRPGIAFVVQSTSNGIRRQRRSHLLEGGSRRNGPNEKKEIEPVSSIGGVITNGQDFPAWLKALIRWNASEVSRSSSDASTQPNLGSPLDSLPLTIGGHGMNRGIFDDEMSPLVASLSGMVDVATLVAAFNETNDEIDLITPNTNDPKRTIKTSEPNGGVNGSGVGEASSMKLFPFLDKALRWDVFTKNIQELAALVQDDSSGMNVTFEELVNMVPDNDLFYDELDDIDQVGESKLQSNDAVTADKILQVASSVFSPSAFQSMIVRASNALAIQEASGNLTAAAYSIFEQAGRAPKATAEYTAELVRFANGVITGGYSNLFRNYPSLRKIPVQEQRHKIIKAAEFATLSGAIYEDTISKTHSVEHSIIARGKTADISWMVTDSIQYERDFWPQSNDKNPTLVRTFTLRGYDASDVEVDREGLLNMICTASPVSILKNEDTLVRVHEGMLTLAQELSRELERYFDMTSPSHKFVFTGFVRQKVLRVFTYGSPPIFEIFSTSDVNGIESDGFSCSILDSFDVPTDIVYSYNQPFDPIIRLFSQYDPLYPLIDDLGEDGYTPWISGPSRTLRPVLKTILESWEGWPRFRDNARASLGQNYRCVGEQYLLLPEPTRYLTDRLVSVNIQVPEIDTIMQISSIEILPALNQVFTLDTFTISYVSVAIRSFVHHFYPAYGPPIVDFCKKIVQKN
ncbi:hypothetical protein ACHAXA_009371 [Cyclostephanos tholiformis]|uniref:Uncharacterized protein n=1 Tax=Cyclostephanos tholiformis TaxID=382380 RepID=A0ABD3SR92_9STRA